VLLTPVHAVAILVVDDDGFYNAATIPPGCDGAVVTPYTTVQAAVTAANNGDTIRVCPGTYTEQVTIPPTFTQPVDPLAHSLILQSTSPLTAVIKAPASMAVPKAIVRVNGATGVAIRDFTISGPGDGTCDSIRTGIRVDAGGSATIERNHITAIRDEPFGGCQTGVGILVGRNFEATTGTAVILKNTIDDYQKGGIVVDNAGSSATIDSNIVSGAGSTTATAQNGIQVSRGATAIVKKNKVEGNWFIGADWTASGILIFESDGVLVQSNKVSGSQSGIVAETWCWAVPSASLNIIKQNTVSDAESGITVDAVEFPGLSSCNALANTNQVLNNTLTSSGETGIFVGIDDSGGVYMPTANSNKVSGNKISGLGVLPASSTRSIAPARSTKVHVSVTE
jgi:nitrous oxidase accessory protein NosD